MRIIGPSCWILIFITSIKKLHSFQIKTLRLATSYISYLTKALESDDPTVGFKAELSSLSKKTTNHCIQSVDEIPSQSSTETTVSKKILYDITGSFWVNLILWINRNHRKNVYWFIGVWNQIERIRLSICWTKILLDKFELPSKFRSNKIVEVWKFVWNNLWHFWIVYWLLPIISSLLDQK